MKQLIKHNTTLRNVALYLAVCVGTIAACTCVLIVADKYNSAKSKYNAQVQETQGWEACRLTKPDYFKAHEEEANNSKKNLEEAKNNFWIQRPKQELVGIFILSGLVSAVAGYLSIWVSYLICNACLRTLFRGLSLCFGGKRVRGVAS